MSGDQPVNNSSGNGSRDADHSSLPSGTSAPEHAAGMLDLDMLLAQFAEKLVTVDTISLPHFRSSVEEPVERVQIMIFVLGDVLYALTLEHIVEVTRDQLITPVPGLPSWLLGVANLHGDIISVVDLAQFLHIAAPSDRSSPKLIVARAADQRIGLLVDAVELIHTLPAELIISPPFEVQAELAPYLRGAAERDRVYIRVLDGERLLTSPQMQQFQ